jgi:hypothetical protein
MALGDLPLTNGKYYWEVSLSNGSYLMVGVATRKVDLVTCLGFDNHGYGYYPLDPSVRCITIKDGGKWAIVPYGKKVDLSLRIGIYVDMDEGELYYFYGRQCMVNTSQFLTT